MKTISRRALFALVFGFLTLATGASLARGSEKPRTCCARQESCCSSSKCCEGEYSKGVSAYNQTAERYRVKYGRDFPGTRPVARTKPASDSCCRNCC